MKRIYLVDLDGVVVQPGTQNLLPGAVEALKRMQEKGEIWFFSTWAVTPAHFDFLNSLGVTVSGFIPKPDADEYVYIDDKLLVESCRRSLT